MPSEVQWQIAEMGGYPKGSLRCLRRNEDFAHRVNCESQAHDGVHAQRLLDAEGSNIPTVPNVRKIQKFFLDT
jgi:hypothetical protein